MKNRDSLISAVAALACALGLYWVIGAVVYYRRSDNSRYRGRFEPSDGRKVRSPLFNNIVTILLTAMVSIVFVLVIFSVARYVARAQIELKTVVPLFKRLT